MPPKTSQSNAVTEARLIEILDVKLHNLKESIIADLQKQIFEVNEKCKSLSNVIIQQQLQIDFLENQNLTCNLVMTGIPDSNDKKADSASIHTICNVADDTFAATNIVNYFRLGKAVAKKPRPVKVIFQTPDLRNKVLLGRKNLRTRPEFQNIFVNRDESKLRRAENARLRRVAKGLRANCTPTDRKKIFFKNGKLMNNGIEVDSFDLKNQLSIKLD